MTYCGDCGHGIDHHNGQVGICCDVPDCECSGFIDPTRLVCQASTHPEGLWGCDCPDCMYLQQQCRLDDAASDGS